MNERPLKAPLTPLEKERQKLSGGLQVLLAPFPVGFFICLFLFDGPDSENSLPLVLFAGLILNWPWVIGASLAYLWRKGTPLTEQRLTNTKLIPSLTIVLGVVSTLVAVAAHLRAPELLKSLLFGFWRLIGLHFA